MLTNNFEINVLIKGRPITEYFHNGQTYVEGRDGSNFEIEFKNKSHFRVEAVLSVDGLSVIDGAEAGPQSSGYLVNARETVRIPGWKLSAEQVAAFIFAGKGKSYAAASTGSSNNTGVIGALVFAEKPNYANNHPGYIFATPSIIGRQTFGSPVGQYASHTKGLRGMAPMGGVLYGASSASPVSYGMHNGIASNNVSPGCPTSIDDCSISASTTMSTSEPVQTLGTGFGQAREFNTTEVSFERGDLSAMMVVYYDDARGLRARGIEISRTHRVTKIQPQAFPAMKNCTPPAGWEG